MDREHILATLRRHAMELKRLGVSNLFLFGSAARDETGPASLRHEYHRVEPAIVWNITHSHLPGLLLAVQRMLADEANSEGY